MGNLIDKAVEYVNPIAGVRRAFARKVLRIRNSGYGSGGASTARTSMSKWIASSGNARSDIEVPLPLLRQRSRDLFMNSGIARAALTRLDTNVIGSGLKLRAMPDGEYLGLSKDEAADWARTVERRWRLWADSKDCDAVGLNTFDELQHVAFLSWLHSGDAFALLALRPMKWVVSDLRIQLIEADRIETPQDRISEEIMHSGVETDANGRVVAYHIRNTHPTGLNYQAQKIEYKRIPVRGASSGRRNILHLIAAETANQYRGVPLLAPVIEDCKQISRYKEAELMAAVIAAMYTVFIKSETPETPLGEVFLDEAAVEADEEAGIEAVASPQDTDNQFGLGNGTVLALNPNESIDIANPGRPNATFEGFVNAVAREIGAALDIPAEMVLLQFGQSYSASRAALQEFWKSGKRWRGWFAADFTQPTYEEWLILEVLAGRVDAPGILDDALTAAAWMRAEWHGPAPAFLDPKEEVQAATMRVEQGFSTRTREAAEINGSDYESNIQGLAEERDRREAAGIVHGAIPLTAEPVESPNQ